MLAKRNIAAVVAEFLGTAVLAFTFLSVSRSNIGIAYFVALAAGLSVLLMGAAVGRGMHMNPALTLGLWTARRIKPIKAVAFIAAQLLGGWAALALYKYFANGQMQPVSVAFDSKILVAEAVGTFVFAFAAAGVLYQRSLNVVRAAVTGGGYALGVIVASAASSAFINPAVALGSNAWAWRTTVLGPVLGAVIGVNLYGLLFAPAAAAPEAAAPVAAEPVAAAPVAKAKAAKSSKSKTAKKK